MGKAGAGAAVAGLADAERRIEGAFGAEALVCLEGGARREVEVIPTGALSLDLALGVGASREGGSSRSTGRSPRARRR